MTARNHWDPNAGPWVAYREAPRKAAWGGEARDLSFVYRVDAIWHAWTSDPGDAIRFTTRREAETLVRSWSGRHPGQRTGACRVEDGQRMRAEANEENRRRREAAEVTL